MLLHRLWRHQCFFSLNFFFWPFFLVLLASLRASCFPPFWLFSDRCFLLPDVFPGNVGFPDFNPALPTELPMPLFFFYPLFVLRKTFFPSVRAWIVIGRGRPFFFFFSGPSSPSFFFRTFPYLSRLALAPGFSIDFFFPILSIGPSSPPPWLSPPATNAFPSGRPFSFLGAPPLKSSNVHSSSLLEPRSWSVYRLVPIFTFYGSTF